MMLLFYILLFIWYNSAAIQMQDTSAGYQSLFSLSNFGMKFSPKNEQALLLSDINVDSNRACLQACHTNVFCRIFDFDGQTNQCRLFEGDINIMDTIIDSSLSLSIVGWIQINSQDFSERGLSCSFCAYSRYLTCINSTCQCLSHTYFNGSTCRSQSLLGGQCINETACRLDLNLTCLPRQQCGPLSLQYGVTVAGYSNGTTGNALDALSLPFGVAINRDDLLLVSDAFNARILRLPAGSLIGNVIAGIGTAGSGITQLNFPSHLFVDEASNVYISDTLNGRIMLWLNGSSSGMSVTGSTRISGRTVGIVVDSQRNVYVSETDNHRVTKWAPNATSGIVVAGTGISGSDSQHLQYPYGLHLDELQSYLYVADYGNNRIQRFTLGVSMNGTTVAGGNGLGTNNNQLHQPQALYVSTKASMIYIADTYNNRITRWNLDATSGVTLVGVSNVAGTTATLLYGPAHITLNKNETYLYVADLNNNRIQRFELI